MLRANIFWQLIRYLALYSVNYRVPFVFTCVQLYSSSLLVFHSCSLVFTRVLLCSIRVHSCSIRVHLCSLVFTSVHSCSDSCGVLDQIYIYCVQLFPSRSETSKTFLTNNKLFNNVKRKYTTSCIKNKAQIYFEDTLMSDRSLCLGCQPF